MRSDASERTVQRFHIVPQGGKIDVHATRV
jgi:hypothetical protein